MRGVLHCIYFIYPQYCLIYIHVVAYCAQTKTEKPSLEAVSMQCFVSSTITCTLGFTEREEEKKKRKKEKAYVKPAIHAPSKPQNQ